MGKKITAFIQSALLIDSTLVNASKQTYSKSRKVPIQALRVLLQSHIWYSAVLFMIHVHLGASLKPRIEPYFRGWLEV